ncbi:hypothetical protein [Mesorhizobium caraganae]|uniref:hypothetical protein n=1 Tax=Mesorhizobium caraganae TaxID=483206 RepID=UPI00333B08FB
MIFAMASPSNTKKCWENTKKRWTAMDSADSFLPFQDWRWLVTRRGAVEKPGDCMSPQSVEPGPIAATTGCGRTKVTAN